MLGSIEIVYRLVMMLAFVLMWSSQSFEHIFFLIPMIANERHRRYLAQCFAIANHLCFCLILWLYLNVTAISTSIFSLLLLAVVSSLDVIAYRLDACIHVTDLLLEHTKVSIQLLNALLLKLRKFRQSLQFGERSSCSLFPRSLWHRAQVVSFLCHDLIDLLMDFGTSARVRLGLCLQLY